MKYAVVQTGGKQYKVSVGDILEVEKLDAVKDADVKFENVLLYASDGAFTVGQPHVNGAIVAGTVLEQKKGDKIRVAKFKAKARYRKVTGHRQLLTKVQIEKIELKPEKGAKDGSLEKSKSKKG